MINNKKLYTLLFNLNADTVSTLKAIRQAGFDGVSTDYFYTTESIDTIAQMIRDAGLEYACIHCPFTKAELMWRDDEQAKPFMEETKQTIQDAHNNGVPKVVMHAYNGFDYVDEIGVNGARHFEEILDFAKERNVLVCLENTLCNDYFYYLTNLFLGKHPAMRICFDFGHENVQSFSKGDKFVKKFGQYLAFTHLHDNDTIRDSHCAPGDGASDWDILAVELNSVGFCGDLALEVIPVKSNRNEMTPYHFEYEKMSADQYYNFLRERITKLLVSKLK